MKRGSRPGLRSSVREVTSTDSEQLILASKLWQNMTRSSLQQIQAHEGKAEFSGEHSFHIALNRSSCRGCARALVADLVNFWTELDTIAHPQKQKGWEKTRDEFREKFKFLLSFSSMYQFPQEGKFDYKNFDEIRRALAQAGWSIQVEQGFSGNAGDNEQQDSKSGTVARERLQLP